MEKRKAIARFEFVALELTVNGGPSVRLDYRRAEYADGRVVEEGSHLGRSSGGGTQAATTFGGVIDAAMAVLRETAAGKPPAGADRNARATAGRP